MTNFLVLLKINDCICIYDIFVVMLEIICSLCKLYIYIYIIRSI